MRQFVLRTEEWVSGLEVHIFEGGEEVGMTQTYLDRSEGEVRSMASDWIELAYGLTDDEYTIQYEP